ncbi:uncharacterized protein LOC105931212 isoform X1 [Fundulus heteroclitus]|uniref:uncharacterized protein LOC105931212 isoform X1 n=2 Tax=Fundulus heteroclitus TaxID=8078 RepID=UPI00165ADF41|nr:uncharacterized protein LOC105931212 isoform X1 [Fundulus heteroclitus]
MDLCTIVIIAAYSLASTVQANDSITTTGSPMKNNTSPTPCSCSKVTQATPTSSSSSLNLILGILNVTWKNNCEGTIHLFPYPTFNSSPLPVCSMEDGRVQTMLGEVCQHKRGCKNKTMWKLAKEELVDGYNITEKGASKTTRCQKLQVHCEVEKLPDLQGELSAYKAVTALLSIVLLILLLMRFTRPTVAALQKRLSDRRQHHWVGPTQSHSVSYHRGKSAVKNDDDEEKRFSYPALERLTVGDSSPSCNRNFYNF